MKTLLIIGGGVAGLSAGILARRCGFDVRIFEQNQSAGGFCCAWQRGGFGIEGGMHWLTGSSPNASLNRLWRQVGAIDEHTAITHHDPFISYQGEDGPIHLYRDPERLRAHLLQVSPADKKAINRLVKDIRLFSKLDMPLQDQKNLKSAEQNPPPVKMLFSLPAAMPRMISLQQKSVKQYASAFRHPGIQALLKSFVGERFAASSLLFTLGQLAAGDCGFPQGGSAPMIARMQRQFESLGGQLHLGTKVERILLEDNRATGILVGGEAIMADSILVTVDALAAISSLFRMPLNESWTRQLKRGTTIVNSTLVSYGIAGDFSAQPPFFCTRLREPFYFAGRRYDQISINRYTQKDGYAPEGKSVITIILRGDSHAFWQEAKQMQSYQHNKDHLAKTLYGALKAELAWLPDSYEMTDVATPLSYERYTGAARGSWMTTAKKYENLPVYPCRSEKYKGLYFAGQRMRPPGGLPMAAVSARSAVQCLCIDHGLVYRP